MRYEKPELIVVDAAFELVLGQPEGIVDNGVLGEDEASGLALGLDD